MMNSRSCPAAAALRKPPEKGAQFFSLASSTLREQEYSVAKLTTACRKQSKKRIERAVSMCCRA